MPPGGNGMRAEFGLGAGEGLSASLPVFEALIKALHERSSGGVIDFPEAEEAGACPGDGDGALEAVDHLTISEGAQGLIHRRRSPLVLCHANRVGRLQER